MSKAAYGVIGGAHRKIKKGYGVVDDVNRKIKKAYSIIGGVARLWFTSEGLAYYGKATNLATGRYLLSAASVGNYVLFAGGATASSTYSKAVSAYSGSLTRSTPTALQDARSGIAATSLGDYALFHGGKNASAATDRLYYYNSSLTRNYKSTYYYRADEAAATVGSYALFAGGSESGTTSGSGYAISVNTSLAVSKVSATLSEMMTRPLAATAGNYALIAQKSVTAYNSSLARTVATALPDNVGYGAAATVGDYALFCPPGASKNSSSPIYVYNASLTQSTISSGLAQQVRSLAATSVGKYALFAGGYYMVSVSGSLKNSYPTAVTIYDTSLTKTTGLNLSAGRGYPAAGVVGNYALFAGGTNADGSSNVVDVFVAS